MYNYLLTQCAQRSILSKGFSYLTKTWELDFSLSKLGFMDVTVLYSSTNVIYTILYTCAPSGIEKYKVLTAILPFSMTTFSFFCSKMANDMVCLAFFCRICTKINIYNSTKYVIIGFKCYFQ